MKICRNLVRKWALIRGIGCLPIFCYTSDNCRQFQTYSKHGRNCTPNVHDLGLEHSGLERGPDGIPLFDARTMLQKQVSDQLFEHFGDEVFQTVIPRNVRLAEAPSYGLPGVVFDPSARGSQAFIAFAEEMVERIKKM